MSSPHGRIQKTSWVQLCRLKTKACGKGPGHSGSAGGSGEQVASTIAVLRLVGQAEALLLLKAVQNNPSTKVCPL